MIKVGNAEFLEPVEILEENNKFSYSDFFQEEHPEAIDYGAVGVITANQYITMKNINDGKSSHSISWANILFNINTKFKNDLLSTKNVKMRSAGICQIEPNIYVRILNESLRIVLFQIPNKVSKEHLITFKRYIEQYGEEIDSLENVQLAVSTNEGLKEIQSVEEIIEVLETQIDYNIQSQDDLVINDVSNLALK